MLKKLVDEVGTTDALNNIGIHYFEQGSYKKAIDYALQALDKAKKNDITEIREYKIILAKLDEIKYENKKLI